MSEVDVVKNSRKAYTKEMLINDLKQLGLEENDNVLVHSSLSKLGWIIGSERTVLSAILEIVGQKGTVVMPCFSGDNSNPVNWQCPPVPTEWINSIKDNMPPFDPILSPTRIMGKIVDLFRHYPGVKRSYHPQVSFCALGPLSDELLSNHQIAPGFGEESPLQRMYNKNFKVLLLGVGYDNCTCMHLGEVWLDKKPRVQTGSRIIKDGQNIWQEYEEIDYDDSDFQIIGEAYEHDKVVNKGIVGQGQARLVDMKSISDFAYDWMIKNRNQ
ncbi:MAG: AAC(3) family N-acetyltransferase [Coprobacillus sp.]